MGETTMNETSAIEPLKRPRHARGLRKDVYLRVRISQADRLAIYRAAADNLATVGGYVRGVVLDHIASAAKGPQP
jgi:hypothetical protein